MTAEWVSVAEAAGLCGCSATTVKDALRGGRVVGRRNSAAQSARYECFVPSLRRLAMCYRGPLCEMALDSTALV